MPFKLVKSGNPAFQPRDSRGRRAAEQILAEHGETIVQTAIDLARDGDMRALQMCLDRVYPKPKERRLAFKLPPLKTMSDAVAAMTAIVQGVADGELTVGEAASLAGLVDAFRRILWDAGLEPRLARLEQIACELDTKDKK